MTALTYDEIFEAAAQIMLFIDRLITIHFTLNAVRIRFPTTRKLAEHLQMPHYYILPYFATMEKEDMITRVERVGISTTRQGSRKLIKLMAAKYKEQIEAILGASLFNEIQQRTIGEEGEKKQTT